MKIGLYFGSFNPIHNGHLIIANYIANNSELEQVWLVVSPQNPFKKSAVLLNEYDRLFLARIAVEDEPRLKVSDVEFKLPQPSYTIDTLIYLEEKFPQNEFSIIMGSDSYQNLHKWKNTDLILKKYSIIVYERPGHKIREEEIKGTRIKLLKAPLLEISATTIRQNIKRGKSIRYLVPEKVREEIEKSGYYKSEIK